MKSLSRRWHDFWFDHRYSWWFKHPNTWYWWVRHRTINRYHILDLKIEPGWADLDYILRHAMFRCLELYVEQERDGPEAFQKRIDEIKSCRGCTWPDEEGEEGSCKPCISSQRKEQQALDLYIWWQQHKTKEDGYVDPHLHSELYAEETAKMIELVELRRSLWS